MSIYGAPTVSPYPRSPRVIRSAAGDGSNLNDAPYPVNGVQPTPAPVVDPQRVRMEQNMGIRQREPSNPTYAMTRAYQTLNAADAATNPAPSPSPSPAGGNAAPGAWLGVPFKLDQTNASPAVGNAPAVNAPTVPNQRMNAGNGISDQVARQMYKVAMSQNPGNLAAGQQQFHDTMAKYGVNGHALLDVWGGGKAGPQTDFVTGYQTSAPSPRVDMNLGQGQNAMGAPITQGSGGQPLLVTRPNGQTVMVDAHGQMVGPPIAQGAPLPDVRTPIVGPKPGYTNVPSDAVLGNRPTVTPYQPGQYETPDQVAKNSTTKASQAADNMKLYDIRDEYQAPFGSNARDISPAPIVAQPPSPAQVAGAQSVLNNIPPTTRERFNAATDVGMAQAQAPLEKVALQNEGKANVVQAQQEAQTQRTTETNETKKGIAAGNNQTTLTNTDKKVAGAKDVAEIQAAVKAAVAAGKTFPTTGAKAPTPQNIKDVFAQTAKLHVPNESFDPAKDFGPGNYPQRSMTPDEAKEYAYNFYGLEAPGKKKVKVTASGAATAGADAAATTPPAQAPATTQPTGEVQVISPEGVPGTLPADKLEAAMARGFKRAS